MFEYKDAQVAEFVRRKARERLQKAAARALYHHVMIRHGNATDSIPEMAPLTKAEREHVRRILGEYATYRASRPR